MKYVYAQTVIREDKLNELKRRTGMNTKDALVKAVEHYLACQLDMGHIGIKRIEHNLNVIKELKEELTG